MEPAIDRIMMTYDLLVNRTAAASAEARAKVTDYLKTLMEAGEKDTHRLTVCGLTYLRELDGSSDPVKAGYTGHVSGRRPGIDTVARMSDSDIRRFCFKTGPRIALRSCGLLVANRAASARRLPHDVRLEHRIHQAVRRRRHAEFPAELDHLAAEPGQSSRLPRSRSSAIDGFMAGGAGR